MESKEEPMPAESYSRYIMLVSRFGNPETSGNHWKPFFFFLHWHKLLLAKKIKIVHNLFWQLPRHFIDVLIFLYHCSGGAHWDSESGAISTAGQLEWCFFLCVGILSDSEGAAPHNRLYNFSTPLCLLPPWDCLVHFARVLAPPKTQLESSCFQARRMMDYGETWPYDLQSSFPPAGRPSL